MAHVVIGLSGGVDSSVAAYLLKRQGHDVTGLFMINWHDTTGTLEGDCPWHDDRVFAELVAKRLDIPLRIVDLSADYRTRVVDYMFAEYEKGRTPNPDVLCNREIKFDVFLREALKLGADFVATGHYCRKAEELLPDGRTVFKLLAGADPNKDQSYFLCQLSQEQLRYALFPIGDLLKPEVRRIAAKQGLATAKRKDSQGICFVGKVDLPAFLQQKLASKKGNVHEILPSWPKYDRALAAAPAKAENAAGPGTSDARTNSTLSTENRAIPAAADAEVARTDGEPSTERLTVLAAPWRYTVRDGKKIGEHNGAHFYTIGQRKGLGTAGSRSSSLRPTPRKTSSTSARATAIPVCGARRCTSLPAKSTGSIPHAPSRPDRAPASASASATASRFRTRRSSCATKAPTSSSTNPSGASRPDSSPHGTTATNWSVRA